MPDARSNLLGVVLMVGATLAGCGRNAEPRPQRTKSSPPPAVVSTITLPSGDGRVHVVRVVTGYEDHRCVVLVPASGPSSMQCLQPAEAYLPDAAEPQADR